MADKQPSLAKFYEKHLLIYGREGIFSSKLKVPVNNRIIEINFDRDLTDLQILAGERKVELATAFPPHPKKSEPTYTNLQEMWELLKAINERTYQAREVIVPLDAEWEELEFRIYGREPGIYEINRPKSFRIGPIEKLDELAKHDWTLAKMDEKLEYPSAKRPIYTGSIAMAIETPQSELKLVKSDVIADHRYSLSNTHVGRIKDIQEHLLRLDEAFAKK